MLFHEGSEISVSTSFSILIIELHKNLMRMSLLITNLFGKINIPYPESTLVDVVVDSLFGKPDFIGMSGKYVVDGLSFINQRH